MALRKERKVTKLKDDGIANAAAIKDVQDKSWGSVVAIDARFKDDKELRDGFVKYYDNEALGLKNNPLGPFLAASAAHFEKYGGVPAVLDEGEGDGAGDGEGDGDGDTGTRAEGIAAERSRQERLKKATMHGSGKGGNKATVVLTEEQKKAARRARVTDEQYIESLRDLGHIK